MVYLWKMGIFHGELLVITREMDVSPNHLRRIWTSILHAPTGAQWPNLSPLVPRCWKKLPRSPPRPRWRLRGADTSSQASGKKDQKMGEIHGNPMEIPWKSMEIHGNSHVFSMFFIVFPVVFSLFFRWEIDGIHLFFNAWRTFSGCGFFGNFRGSGASGFGS